MTGTAASSGGADDGGGASLVDGASSGGDGSAAGNADSLADVDAGPEPPFVPSSSCKTLLQNNPWKLGKSGFYDIDPDDAGNAQPRISRSMTAAGRSQVVNASARHRHRSASRGTWHSNRLWCEEEESTFAFSTKGRGLSTLSSRAMKLTCA